MKNFFSMLFGVLLLSTTYGQQEELSVIHSCGYEEELPPADWSLRAPSPKDEKIVQAVLDYFDQPPAVTLKVGDHQEVMITYTANERLLVCDRLFLDQLQSFDPPDWMAIGKLVHVLAHHVLEHAIDAPDLRQEEELQADFYAGEVMYRMGASFEDASYALDQLEFFSGNDIYPPKFARISALKEGWEEAGKNRVVIDPIQDKTILARGVAEEESVVPTDYEEYQPAIRTSLNPVGDIKEIWEEFGVVENGREGMRIHLKFVAQQLRNVPCKAVVWFHDIRARQPLTDQNGLFATADGKVSADINFTPRNDFETYSDLRIFIPYEEFHLAQGDHRLKYRVGLFYREGDQFNKLGKVGEDRVFSYTKEGPKAGTTFERIWFEEGVVEAGKRGLRIHARFNLRNLKDRNCRAVAWFYDDAGEPIKDYNGIFKTPEGFVSTGVDFIPDSDESTFRDLLLFIPYDELHMPPDQKELQFKLGLFLDASDGFRQIGDVSDLYTFRYKGT